MEPKCNPIICSSDSGMQNKSIALIFFLTFNTIAFCAAEGNSSSQLSTVTLSSTDSTLIRGFSYSCASWEGNYGSDYAVMQATCRNKAGGYNTSTINLNDCIANAGTSLACAMKCVWRLKPLPQ